VAGNAKFEHILWGSRESSPFIGNAFLFFWRKSMKIYGKSGAVRVFAPEGGAAKPHLLGGFLYASRAHALLFFFSSFLFSEGWKALWQNNL